MLRAAPRERLDFSLVANVKRKKPELATVENTMTAKQEKKIDAWKKEARAGFQKRLEAKRASGGGFVTPSAPRYDDVFSAGLTALDAQAGDAITPGRMTCSISPDVWKSHARYDPDLS
jgi:hypothetical protein